MLMSRRSADEGDMTLRVESGDPRVKADRWGALLYMAASWDPYELIDRGEVWGQHDG